MISQGILIDVEKCKCFRSKQINIYVLRVDDSGIAQYLLNKFSKHVLVEGVAGIIERLVAGAGAWFVDMIYKRQQNR